MPSELPTLIAIDRDDYHADRVGTTQDGTQFFVTTPFIPEFEGAAGREFLPFFSLTQMASFARLELTISARAPF